MPAWEYRSDLVVPGNGVFATLEELGPAGGKLGTSSQWRMGGNGSIPSGQSTPMTRHSETWPPKSWKLWSASGSPNKQRQHASLSALKLSKSIGW